MSTIELAKGVSTSVTDSVATVATSLVEPNPITELGFSTLVLVVIIVFHGWCLNRVSKYFSTRFALYTPYTPRWRVSSLSSSTIATLVIIHLFETMLWAVPIWQLGIIPDFRDAYYYVLEAYTTLGEGNVTLPDEWRLAGPVIAISGLFTFGWTASVLVYVMNQIAKLHSQTSRDAAKAEARHADPEA